MGPAPGRPPGAHPGGTAAENIIADQQYDTASQEWDRLPLLPQHVEVLSVRGISPAVARERGYRSAHSIREIKTLGFAEAQARPPGLIIPLHNVAGELAGYQYRPDAPRMRDGKPIKYESPPKSAPVLDCPPRARRWVLDPEQPLLVTEGSMKADAAAARDLACLAIAGVWNWRSPDVITALDQIPLRGRTVYLAFDSDWRRKPAVEAALRRLAAVLRQRGAIVRAIVLPENSPGMKVGLDDWLAQGHGALDLFALPAVELDGEDDDTAEPQAAGEAGPYVIRDGGLCRVEVYTHDDGQPRVSYTPLTNFVARIAGDVARDDGSGEVTRAFDMEAVLGERQRRFTIPASQFAGMGWVTEHLGAGAIVYPGQSAREHARVAIQMLSGEVPERRVFTHTGWRQIDGRRLYLHAGGVIGQVGQDGQVFDVQIDLPAPLARALLPTPPAGEERVPAIRASLGLLDLAPDTVTVPVFAAIYRAVLGETDLALHLTGETGEGKTELAALAQQHYGAGFDARNLPGSWLSTGNALEAVAFAAKDMLIVVDDFVPGADPQAAARLYREAERLLRAQGNAAGRLRLRPDATLRPAKPPRGLILSTGEDVPRGHSLRARLLILELPKGNLDWSRLTACQREAAEGQYAPAMAAFVAWVADRFAEVQADLRRETLALREAAQRSALHRRTPAIVASLGAGLRIWLRFAQDAGALSPEAAERLWQRAWAALGAVAAAQAGQQAASEPASRFLTLVAAALASGRAHLAAPDGGAPADAQAWGWRSDGEHVRPLGERIGWVDGEALYLEPEVSYAVAQRLARDGGDALPVSASTLRRRLAERGYLIRESAREAVTARRTLEGQRRAVLALCVDALQRGASFMCEKPDQPDQAPADRPDFRDFSGSAGQVLWSGFALSTGKPDQQPDHEPDQKPEQPCGNGAAGWPAGQVGQVLLHGYRSHERTSTHALPPEGVIE